MKKNDFMQIKGLDIKELKTKAKTLRVEIADLTMDKNMKKGKDVKKLTKTRKDLAQVLTIVRQKELLQELESKIEKPKEEPKVLKSKESKVKKEAIK